MAAIVVLFLCAALGAALARLAPAVARFAAAFAPLALAAALLAIPADEARADTRDRSSHHCGDDRQKNAKFPARWRYNSPRIGLTGLPVCRVARRMEDLTTAGIGLPAGEISGKFTPGSGQYTARPIGLAGNLY